MDFHNEQDAILLFQKPFFPDTKIGKKWFISGCMQTNPFAWKLGDVGEPLKIDLLQPLASARLVLHPYEAADLLEFGRWHGILFEISLARKSNCPMVTVFKFSEIECGVNSGLNAHSGSPEGLL